jgi:hypothetical protein
LYNHATNIRDIDQTTDPKKAQITICDEFARMITEIPFSSSKLQMCDLKFKYCVEKRNKTVNLYEMEILRKERKKPEQKQVLGSMEDYLKALEGN